MQFLSSSLSLFIFFCLLACTCVYNCMCFLLLSYSLVFLWRTSIYDQSWQYFNRTALQLFFSFFILRYIRFSSYSSRSVSHRSVSFSFCFSLLLSYFMCVCFFTALSPLSSFSRKQSNRGRRCVVLDWRCQVNNANRGDVQAPARLPPPPPPLLHRVLFIVAALATL